MAVTPKIVSFLVLCLLLVSRVVAADGETWETLRAQADSLSKAQDCDSALAVGNRALELAAQELGSEDSTVAAILWALGNDYYHAGDYEEAISFHERALAIREKVLGQDHPDVATSLKDLAIAYKALDRFDEGESAVKRALAIWEKARGPEDSTMIAGLATLGDIYAKEGRFSDAEPPYKKSLAICQRTMPSDNYNTAYLLNNLGWLRMEQGRYNEAESLNAEALEMRERLLGGVHPMVAKSLGDLASTYWRQGRYSEAEALFKRAQAIYEKPPGDPNLAAVLFNLANLYGDEGKYAEAEALYRDAMSIEEKTYGPSSPEVGLDIQLIAGLRSAQGDYSNADSLYELALRIYEESSGPDHIYTAGILQDMANSLQAQRKYPEAEPLYERALAVFERDLGPESPEVASTLTNLGNLYLDQAQHAKAESLYARALDIRERLFGTDHPAVAEVYQSLSKYCRMRGDPRKSLQLGESAFQIMRQSFLDNSYDLPEKDALTFSLLMRNAADNYLSCYLDAGSVEDALVRSACEVIFKSKGEVSDGIFERRRVLITETDSATVALSDSLRYTRLQISRLFVAGPEGDTAGAYGALLDSLHAAADGLESRLATASASFRSWEDRREVSAQRIASHLPANAVLVEYLRYNYYAVRPDTVIRRYLAAVMDGNGASSITDLGEASSIDSLVSDYHGHMLRVSSREYMPLTKDKSEYAAIAQKLHAAVLGPIEEHLSAEAMLLVAPDGGLNLVSFAGLIDGRGQYLIEKAPIQYLSAARDLIRIESKDGSGIGLLALGDPSYDSAGGERLVRADAAKSGGGGEYATARPNLTRSVQSGCEDFRKMRVGPLPHTRREIGDVVRNWHSSSKEPVLQLLGPLASEDNFKAEAPGKRAIHLATHGYFIEGRCKPRHVGGGAQADTVFVGENPLLLSGLLLAGANLHGKAAESLASDDGVLTAYEVSAMDLGGAETVVLSACETGLGEVKQGEGVYGLRRAFQMAGARTVVSALWSVPDDVTAEMMASLYTQSDEPLPERMRAAQLAEIKRLRSQDMSDHPYRWAAFVALGDWR